MFNEICGGDLDDDGQFQRLKSRAHCYVERDLLRAILEKMATLKLVN